MSNTEKKGQGFKGKGRAGARRVAARRLFALTLCLVPFALSGCRIDMQDQPRYEYYEPGDKKFFPDGASSRATVEGTVPRQPGGAGAYRDREDYFYTGKSAASAAQGNATAAVRANVPASAAGAATSTATGEADRFPIPIDRAAVERGRDRYQIYCAVCHGMTGEGDGMIVRRGFQKPPSFYDDRLQENQTPASHFFDVITNGWGAMPDYASAIPAEDRWKIIAYLRALQLSRSLKVEELSPTEQDEVRKNAQPQAGHGEGGTPSQAPRGGEKH